MKSLFLAVAVFAHLANADTMAGSESSRSTGDSALASTANKDGRFVQLIPHPECKELRIDTQVRGMSWNGGHSSGGTTINDSQFSGLKSAKLHGVSFGKSDSAFSEYPGLTFNFVGKSIFPQVVRESEYYLFSSNALANEEHVISGKIITLVDPKAIQFTDSEGTQHGQLKMAVIYLHAGPEEAPSNVNCEYAAGPIDFQAVEQQSKCIWVDEKSRTSDGKPYCW